MDPEDSNGLAAMALNDEDWNLEEEPEDTAEFRVISLNAEELIFEIDAVALKRLMLLEQAQPLDAGDYEGDDDDAA